mgnify:FL=1
MPPPMPGKSPAPLQQVLVQKHSASSGERLYALDMLRGLDMFVLTVAAPFLLAIQQAWGIFPNGFIRQLNHAPWEGLRAWDLVMPWFIFICGAAIPFALPKHLSDGHAGWRFWRHVLGRVSLLWVLGMAVQGNLLTLNWSIISPYNNTLQAIAAGYLIAACVWLIPKKWIRQTIPWGLAVLYTLLLMLFGDYSLNGNAAIRVDSLVLPMNHDGYGWSLTSMMFGVMTLCGVQCTEWLRSHHTSWRKMFRLLWCGAGLFLGGILFSGWIPAIKRIYTITFTAQAMGLALFVLAGMFFLFDIVKVRKGTGLLLLFGRAALVAYVAATLFAPTLQTTVRILTQGLQPWTSGSTPVIQSFLSACLLTGILWVHTQLKARRPHA